MRSPRLAPVPGLWLAMGWVLLWKWMRSTRMGRNVPRIDGAHGVRCAESVSRKLHKGADALAATLVAHGVRRVFALSGNHVMPVFDAALSAGIDLVHVRHEAATVHMADAWARLTGEVGVALVTGGPGHANAVGALYTALMADSPVLLLSGHAPIGELGRGAFQEMRQAEMAAPVTKASWVSSEAGQVAVDVATALQVARNGRPGPVHLSLPTDVLEATVEEVSISVLPAPRPIQIHSLPNGKRPLILCGPACMRGRGRALMAALE